MRFIETWLPLIVLVREGSLDHPEMAQMSTGFERHFARSSPFAVLSLAELLAAPMDAMARQRIAEWGNKPRIQRLSKEFCVGTATVVARDGERRAMTALLWIWTPAAAHDAVHTVARGIDYCLARLVDRKVPLPASREAFHAEISRGLSMLSVAGLASKGTARRSTSPRGQSGTRRVEQLEKLTVGSDHVAIGWLERGVLWASFHGHLSSGLGALYAEKVERITRRETDISYFIDASALDSFDLLGRTVALRALIESRHRLASVQILNWSGGISSTGVAMLQGLGDLVRTTENREEFERRLSEVAPQAREALAARRLEDTTRTQEPRTRNR